MSEAIKVKVGEQDYSIQPFRAYKALLAGKIVARVSNQISKMLEELTVYTTEYRETHTLRITREIAEARADVDPGYKALLEGALKTQPYVELPQNPSTEEQIVKVFAQVFEFGTREAMQMIALALVPNQQLRGAWHEDAVFDKLETLGREVFEEAELGELIDLAVVVEQVLRDQIAPRQEALGKLRALYRRAEKSLPEEETTSETNESPMTSSSTSEPNSSTDSPAATGGPTSRHSSVPAGAS